MMGPEKCYVVTRPQNVTSVFKQSRNLGSSKFEEMVMIKAFGGDKETMKIWQMPDHADTGSVQDMGKLNRKYPMHHLYGEHMLSTRGVNSLTSKFFETFASELDKQTQVTSKETVEVGLHRWLRDYMFVASGTAFLGCRLWELYPSAAEDFWEYDAGMLRMVYGAPRFMIPKIYAALDRLLVGFEAWMKDSHDRGYLSADKSHNDKESRPDWCPQMGSRFIQDRHRLIGDSGITLRGKAALEVGSLFGLASNAIPATSWMLFHIIDDSSLYTEVLAELQTALRDPILKPTSITQLSENIDIPKLVSLPLLFAIYTEVLRLYVAVNVSREVKNSFTLDGHTLKAGRIMMVPSWIGHHDSNYWASPEKFDPSRFLSTDEKGQKQFDGKLTQGGRYFPYGGGAHICPGRLFAKQEILAGVATVLLGFEIEKIGWVNKKEKPVSGFAKPALGYVGNGVMAQDRDLMVKIRRRC